MGDSCTDPTDRGTIDAFEAVLAGLLERVDAGTSFLGKERITVPELLERLNTPQLSNSSAHFHSGNAGRALDDYIEAQIHGVLSLASDIDALVADPSFRNTSTGSELEQLCDQNRVPLVWHKGFQLSFTAEIPTDFRGPAMPILAQRLMKQFRHSGRLHIELVGRAAVSVVQNPKQWEDYGSPAQCLQHLKQLWHVLVWFGDAYHT